MENHTTRPMPQTGKLQIQKQTSVSNFARHEKQNDKGAAGIEPATPGSAIPCSTAELCTRGESNRPICSLRFVWVPTNKNMTGPTGTRTRIEGIKILSDDHYTIGPRMLQEGLEPPTLGLLDPCSTN